MAKVVSLVLGGAVATSGTITVPYPTNTDAGLFVGAHLHIMTALGAVRRAPSGFTVSFGASNITVTYLGSTTLPAGTTVRFKFDTVDRDRPYGKPPIDKVAPVDTFILNLGAPDVLDADGISASQSIGAAGSALINGALAVGGVATFDVPRNVVGAWTTNSIIAVTGTDEYGVVIHETGASAATFTGKKAFKTITSITSTASITSATFGSGDVLGLPIFLPEKAFVLRELEDGAAATAGTLLAGVVTAASATTGDTRGTYDPNSACDGAKSFQLIAAVPNPTYKGVTQF